MLKEIKLPLNTSLLELATVSFFIAVGYSILYKYHFYSELGIEWYIYSLTPNFILLSSVKLLFSIMLGAVIAIIMLKEMDYNYKLALFVSAAGVFSVLSIKFYEYYSAYIDVEKGSLALFYIGFILATIGKLLLAFFKDPRFNNVEKNKNVKIILLVFSVLYFFSLTAFIGKRDAIEMKNNMDKLNIAVIKNNNTHWRLMELSGDKVMLINKVDEKKFNFKIIEAKEIELIKVIN